MEEIIVRHENFGPVIYSKKYKSYFIPKDEEIKVVVENIMKKKVTKEENRGIYEELKKLGYGDKQKDIISKNKDGMMAPLEYYFDFTDVCNLRCSHCYNRENINTTTMKKEMIIKIIEDMYQNGVMRLHLAGGEPTLFPEELDTYMKTAKQYGIRTSMSSNGTNITDEICDIISRNEVMSFTVSIESAREEKNAKIRGEGNLARAIDGIKKLVDHRDKENKELMVTMKVSYDVDMSEEEFEELIKLGMDLRVDMVKFGNPERCVFHEKGHYSKIGKAYYKNIEIVEKLKEKYRNDIIITQINSPANGCGAIGIPNTKGCIGAQELIAISPDGTINPCLMNKYDLGNIENYNSIAEVYQSEEIKQYWNKIQDYSCDTCQNHEKCRGGCQVRKIVEHGEITGSDPLCPARNKITIPDRKENEDKEFKSFTKISVLHSL